MLLLMLMVGVHLLQRDGAERSVTSSYSVNGKIIVNG